MNKLPRILIICFGLIILIIAYTQFFTSEGKTVSSTTSKIKITLGQTVTIVNQSTQSFKKCEFAIIPDPYHKGLYFEQGLYFIYFSKVNENGYPGTEEFYQNRESRSISPFKQGDSVRVSLENFYQSTVKGSIEDNQFTTNFKIEDVNSVYVNCDGSNETIIIL